MVEYKIRWNGSSRNNSTLFTSGKNTSSINVPLNQKFVCRDAINITLHKRRRKNVIVQLLPLVGQLELQPVTATFGLGNNVFICERTRKSSGVLLGIGSLGTIIGYSVWKSQQQMKRPIIDVDEKNQVLTTNLWLEMIKVKWFPYDKQDCRMKFGAWSYTGNYVDLHLIQQENAENINNKINLNKKREEDDDIEYNEMGMDLSFFYKSAEWDLMNLTSARHAVLYTSCCGPETYVDITYYLELRRKT
uniref:Neurotransmitter-gated ion-channel ligand-binding domain-containing protein n=1 Tax=Meloidogyne javanica TaxID=6303 RepID=A0A915MN94_MELJA